MKIHNNIGKLVTFKCADTDARLMDQIGIIINYDLTINGYIIFVDNTFDTWHTGNFQKQTKKHNIFWIEFLEEKIC